MDRKQKAINSVNMTGLTLTDEAVVREQFAEWLPTSEELGELAAEGSGVTVSFFSNYGGEPNGLYTVYSELYATEYPDGEPLHGSERVVVEDATAICDDVWALCRTFGHRQGLPGVIGGYPLSTDIDPNTTVAPGHDQRGLGRMVGLGG